MNYQSRSRTPGFTLVELLVVMGIIMILAGIVIGVQRGVYYQQSKARAVAEMRTIASGLESFKLTYGDYPPMARPSSKKDTNAGERLFAALTGKSRLRGSSSGPVWDPGGKNPSGETVVGPVFIEENSIKRGGTTTSPDDYWVDPWGNTYNYYYKTVDEYGDSAGWGDTNTFILVSAGPWTTGDPAYAQEVYSGSSTGDGGSSGPKFDELSNIREFMDNNGSPRKEIIHGFGN